MKGAIFIALNQVVEEAAGIGAWEQLLDRVQPASGGVYISVESYPDEELFALVKELSVITALPQSLLIRNFGEALFAILNSKYPQFTQAQPDFFEFVKSVDGTIHKEVEKLYHNPNLPSMDCEQRSDSEMLVHYRSPRKLCTLAHGLFAGAASHYQVDCLFEHRLCMHDGADHCEILITRR